MFEALNVELAAVGGVSDTLGRIASAADWAGEEAAEAGVEFGAFGEALDAVDDDALAVAVGANTAKGAVDELGDEALQSAAEMQALDSQMNDVSRSSVGLAGSLGPLRGGLRTIGPLAAGTVPPLISLGGALGGIATAGGAAAGGIAAMAAAGLQRKAEQMAAASSEFKDSSEAMEAIFADVKSAISEAFAPLKTAENTEFAMAGLEGVVDLAHVAADGFAQMQDTLRPLAATFGSAVLETAPAVFDELDTTVQALTPTLEGFAGAIRDIPDALAWFREQAVALQPELGSLAGSGTAAAAGLGRLGTSILNVVLPPLTVALDIIAWTANMLGMIPGPVYAAAAAFGVYTAAVALYGGVAGAASAASAALVATITTLSLPISATAAAIGVLIGAVVGAISYFGLWDDIIGGITGVWNGLVETIEFGIEVTYAMIKAIGQLLGPLKWIVPPLGVLIWTVNNLGTIVEWAGEMFRWFSDLVNDVISSVMGWVDTAIGAIQDLIDWAMAVVDAIPGVNIDFGNIQKTVELDAIKAGGGDEGGDAPDDKRPNQTKQEAKNVYDFSGADFGGASQSAVERTVREAVRKANRESRQREDAHGL